MEVVETEVVGAVVVFVAAETLDDFVVVKAVVVELVRVVVGDVVGFDVVDVVAEVLVRVVAEVDVVVLDVAAGATGSPSAFVRPSGLTADSSVLPLLCTGCASGEAESVVFVTFNSTGTGATG